MKLRQGCEVWYFTHTGALESFSVVYPRPRSPWGRLHDVDCGDDSYGDKTADLHTSSSSSATGRLPPGAALPVHWLAGLQGHAPLQALYPPVGPEAGEVAGAVRRRRWEDCGALPVSSHRCMLGKWDKTVGKEVKDLNPLPTGVPQGFVLGALSFVIYTYSLGSIIHCHITETQTTPKYTCRSHQLISQVSQAPRRLLSVSQAENRKAPFFTTEL